MSNNQLYPQIKRLYAEVATAWKACFGQRRKNIVLDSPRVLGEFIDARASHVAQTALYGYLKTRAGTRFPELFSHEDMLVSINIAKWNIWLACATDLTIYSGVLLLQIQPQGANVDISRAMNSIFHRIIGATAGDKTAGSEFLANKSRARARLEQADFARLTSAENDAIFKDSPAALVHWAPVADELKQRDVAIIRNSVRYRWIEVRRELRHQLRPSAACLS